jgi:hypothetical protein
MGDNTTLVIIATVYAPIIAVWIAAIATALVVPHYALRFRVPWPVLAAMILALLVLATLATWLVVQTELF